MIQRSHQLREAAFLTLTYAHSAARMGRIAALIGELYPDATKKNVQKAAENVFKAASCASQVVLALSKDDVQLARQTVTTAHAAENAVIVATQEAILAATAAITEAKSHLAETDIPDMEGLLSLWEEFRSLTPDPFIAPAAPDDETA